MPEYILRPRNHNYKSGYEYDDASHKTNLAYDNNPDTYWYVTSSGSSSNRTLYNFNFNEIPSGQNIISAKLYVKYSGNGGTSMYTFTKAAVTTFPSSSQELETSDTGTSWQPSKTASGEIVEKEIELIDKTSYITEPGLHYIKNNISSLRNGSTFFGVHIYPNAYSFSPFYLYDIALKVYTEDTTKIFNGENSVTSAYLGNQSISAIYIGDKKLL